MPEFVERPPQPSPYKSHGSNMSVVRHLSRTAAPTLSMALALRSEGTMIPQVQSTTKQDKVHRCHRFSDKSEQCRRAMNMRNFPQLRLMDRPRTNRNPAPVSTPAVAGTARSPQRVLRDFRRCDPVAQNLQRQRRISYPTEVARFSCNDSKFPRTELKAEYELSVKDPPASARVEKKSKPFVPSNQYSARRGVESRFPNIRETWNDDEWLSQANNAEAYAPRDRAMRGVVFSSPPVRQTSKVGKPFALSKRRKSVTGLVRQATLTQKPPPQPRRRPRPETRDLGFVDRRPDRSKPPFSPCSPAKAKANIKPNYFLNLSTRGLKEQEDDWRLMQERIDRNKQKFNDKLFRRFHGDARADRRSTREGSTSRSRSFGTPHSARH